MAFEVDVESERRLVAYFREVGEALGNKCRRAAFSTYAMGLLGSTARKSAEPIAATASADEAACEPAHHRLLRFLRDSPWSDRDVRRIAARHAIDAMTVHDVIRTWIVDDTGFPKQGTHSVGVHRQYTGTTGKISNCQVAVSLSVATRSAHVPIDFALYLPECWTDDPARREECKVPDALVFKTKHDLALDLIVRALEDKVPGDIVLADAGYGCSDNFRETVRVLGFEYAMGILSSTTLVRLDAGEHCRGGPMTARAIADELGPKAFRSITWRVGTRAGPRGKLRSRFAFCRVAVANTIHRTLAVREPLWLMMEWPDDEKAPSKFTLTTLRRTMSKKEIVRTVKERYRTEQVYEEMKGELGLDHFEGRSFPGWNHHVSVAICCYAFVIAERMRHFPPSARRRSSPRPHTLAA